jgi:hypothetical protein
MPAVTYAFDPTGRASENLVQKELHTLTEVNAAPYRILIPSFAPFYSYNLKLEHVDLQGVVHELNEGVDYYLALPYMDATRTTGKSVFGGLPIINNLTNGAIQVTYQTVGSPWCADIPYVYARLVEQVYNPRMTWWDTLSNVQDVFPPIAHDHALDDTASVDILLSHLTSIRDAILQAPSNVPGQIVAHMLDRTIHPRSPADLGLGPLTTMDQATDEEVLARMPLDKIITLRQLLLLLP